MHAPEDHNFSGRKEVYFYLQVVVSGHPFDIGTRLLPVTLSEKEYKEIAFGWYMGRDDRTPFREKVHSVFSPNGLTLKLFEDYYHSTGYTFSYTL